MTITPKAPTPNYPPECHNCRYLGEYEEYSLYVCPLNGVGDTYMAKYGNGGGEYLSYTVFTGDTIETGMQPIRVAYQRHMTLKMWAWQF